MSPSFLFDGVRISFVVESPALVGAERQALLLAAELRAVARAVPEIVCLRNSDDGSDRLREECARLELPMRIADPGLPSSWRRWPAGLSEFARFLGAGRPDVVLPYWNQANVAAALTWRAAGARSCIWGQRDERRSRPPPVLERIAVRSTPFFRRQFIHCPTVRAERPPRTQAQGKAYTERSAAAFACNDAGSMARIARPR